MSDKEMVPKGNEAEVRPLGAWSPFGSFSREIDRLFEDVGRGWGLAPFRFFEPKGAVGGLMPRLDVAETEKEVIVTAELPGVDEKDVEVTLEGDQLSLKGEKKAQTEEKGKNFHRVERSFGSFHRVLGLPVEVDPTKVSAMFKKGVLTVTLAKTPAAQVRSKKIDIQAA